MLRNREIGCDRFFCQNQRDIDIYEIGFSFLAMTFFFFALLFFWSILGSICIAMCSGYIYLVVLKVITKKKNNEGFYSI